MTSYLVEFDQTSFVGGSYTKILEAMPPGNYSAGMALLLSSSLAGSGDPATNLGVGFRFAGNGPSLSINLPADGVDTSSLQIGWANIPQVVAVTGPVAVQISLAGAYTGSFAGYVIVYAEKV